MSTVGNFSLIPTIGSFANKVFKVSRNHLYTFDELTYSGELKVDEQEVDGSKPSTYIKGVGLDKVSFYIILLNQKNIDVKKEIRDWFKIRDSKTPHHLIIGNSNVSSYKFLLTNVDVSETKIGVSGEYLKAKVQLQFSEYVRAGKKENSTSMPSTNTSSATKNKTNAGTTKSSKKSKKRTNNNASKAKSSSKKNSDNKKIEALEKELYG